ncbi:MAG: hypothetical protein LBL83_13965, partial [Clostridiales bacterium]|nr:hypothetical protein [Clostridiales bacterium]
MGANSEREAIAALEPAEPAFGDAVSGGVFARGGPVELIAEETGGTAQAEFYFATKGASRVGTINLRLSYRLADAEGAEFSLPEWLAGGEGVPAKA